MKKIFGNIRTLAALLIASATLAACSTEDSVMTDEKAPQVYTLTIDASMDGGAQTRALALDGTKLVASWADGDKLTVTIMAYDTKLGELTASSVSADGKTCTFSGALDTAPSANDVLTLTYHPMTSFSAYNSQTGTLASAANYDMATATVTVASVSGGEITIINGTATFSTQTAVLKLTLKDAEDQALNATSLKISVGGTDIFTFTPTDATYTTNDDGILYFALPSQAVVETSMSMAEDALASEPVTFTATVGGNTYTATKTGYPFAAGKYYATTLTMAEVVPTGAISGKFSVSATKQVYFSKGNLRYASGAWSFFDNQYDYYTTHDGTNWDKFGWSTSTTTYGMSTSSSGYSGDFVDWGSNSDLQTALGTGWFTLSSAEWTYLFKTRTNAASKYGYATVAGKVGIIIVPDDFTDPMKNNGSGAFVGSTTKGWTANVYSAENWSAMETAGCVFLPAAGYRNGTSVYFVGSYGNYWSSTANGTDQAYSVSFNSEDVTPTDYTARYMGYSVRLVHDVE